MKKRKSFISNSSSTSFVIKLLDNDQEDIFDKLDDTIETFSDKKPIKLSEDVFLKKYYKERRDIESLYVVNCEKNNINRIDVLEELEKKEKIQIIERIPG